MNGMIMGIGCVLGGIFGIMLSVYIALCFAGWIMEAIDNTTWRWKK